MPIDEKGNETPRNDKLSGRQILMIFLLAALVGGASGAIVSYFMTRYELSHPVKSTAVVVPPVKPRVAAPAPSIPSPPSTKQLVMANVVKAGGGVSNPLARQLANDPSLFSDPRCVRRVNVKEKAACNAHALSVLAGFIDPQSPNIEMRVSAPDQYSFVIEKDAGGLQIVEYSVGGKSGTFTKIAAFPVATTMASARFIGPGGGVASYHMDGMYLWIGG